MSLSAHFSRTVIPGLLLLTLLHNSLVLSQTSYYVKYNSTENTTATGAIESPYTSVNQAVTKLGAGTFELLLLGNPVYITTNLVFPSNSNYSIRPASLAEGQTHFPFYFNKAIVTQIKQGTVNMQQIQVIDIDTARATNNPLIRVLQGGILNLDRVKFINVNYSTSYNTLLYAVGSLGVAEINMINCEFKNLTNARMQVSAGKIAIVNTIFSDLVLSRTSFIPMTNSPGSNYSLIFKNVTIQNSRFTNVPSGSTYGFAYIYNYSSPNVIFEDFTVKDVNVTNKIAFILLSVSGIGQTTIPLFKSKNVLVQNFYEVNQPDGTSSQLAIYHQIQGNVTLEYTNFTLTNVQLKNSAFIQSFQLATANPVLAPNATLSGVKIQNSTNIYITLKHFNTISCDDFQLLNNAYGTPYVIIGMLVFSESTNTVMTNFSGQNNTGPLLKTTDVFNPTMRNWTLNDVYTSIKWASRYPIFLTRKRDSLSYTTNQAQGEQSAIIMESIMINGYYDINGLTSTGSDTGTYSMGIITEYGKAYLNNSRFYNMKLSCFGGGYTNHLMIDNLTVDSDPSIPFSAIPTRGIFKFTETRELSIINSRFLNQKNMFIMLMYFLHRSDNYEIVTHPILRFENLTVINNTASTSKTNTAYPSLFNIRTPLYPVTATFKDSFFQGNTVLSAIIMTDESIKIDVDIINNTFVDNYALQESGVISAKSMRGNVSNINLINNTFGNNTSLKYGGVLYFLSTQHNIVSMNNIYYNNSAGISGGVGYFSHADITYTETNCTYFNNSAGSYGGAWFVSLQRTKSKEPRVNFIGTSFEASSSLRKGGAVYIETGDVSLEDSSFTGSSAAEAGGDVYLVALASIAMTRVNSTASYSPQGSLLYAEATANEAMTLQNIQITNIPLSDVDTTVLMMNTGSLNMSDSVLENISSPLFQFTSSSATFHNISINNIHCETEKTTFCIFQGSGSTISAESFYISDVVSNQDLVLMKGSSSNFKVQNFNLTKVKKLRQNREYFALISKKINNTIIQDSSFSQLEFSGINVQGSRLQLANSIFSNAIAGRVLQEDNSTNFLESSPASLEARFVVLDASNSSISGTDFIANSPNAITLNGGAIQITGNAGNHYITGCSFEGNTGLNGGAVSIESAINSLTIENSEFINNIASRNGGSIHLAGQGSNVTPIISQTAFQRNEALVGGAIYVSKSPLRIQNSAFDNNTAQTGAAIVSLCSNSQKVSLSDSTFSLNNARIGASLMALGDLNFNTQTTTFSNNTAEFGGDISGRPHHLAMKVYRVSETFLYLNDVSVEYMLSHYQTVLIYDSQNASLRSPLEMKPGRIPSYIFEFGVQNEVNQIIPLKAMNLTLGSSLNDTASSSILGTLEHSFNQSTGFIFYAFYIRGNFGNTMTLPIQTIALDGFLNQTYTLPILGLPIIIKSCTVGELYDRTKLLCKPCSKDSFTFEDPFVVQSCQQCPETAECLGGSVLYPKPGYWRISEVSDNIVRCGSSDACLGGVTDDERNISLTGSCALGYEGIGCGTCSFGYIRGGLNNECVGCLASGIRVHMKYIAFFFIRAGIIFLTLGLFIIAHNRRAEGKEGGFKEILVIKVIIDFMHIINPILVLHKGWPDEVRDFFDIVSSVTALNRNNFSLDCLIALIRGKNDDVVFIKSAVLLLQPAFFVIFACIVALITAKITRSKIPDLVRNFVAMAVISAYICQPDTIQSLFTLFRCDNFGSTKEEEEFLLEDTNVRCWESHHAYWIIGIAIPALILWLLVPVVLLIRLIWKREYRGSESFIKKYDIILKNYQPQMFFWELVSLGRKLAFIVASMMRYYPYTQTYLGFSVLVTAYFFHKKFMPYSDHQINTAEMISIASSAGLMYTGLYYVHFMSNENMKPYINFLFAVNIVATVILIGYCTYIVRFMIKKTIRLLTKKCTKAIDAKNNKLKKPQAFDGENLLKPPRHGFPLLDLGRSPNLSNISFSPKNGAANMSSYRFKILSPKSTELQSPDAVLKTEPAVTATDEIDKIFTTKSRTLILESERNILSLFPSVGNSPVKNGLHSLSHENKSVKSVDALCLEIEGEAQDTDEHFVGPIVQKNRKKLIEQLERFKEDNNSSSFLSDETIPNVNMIKRSQFYGKGTGRANLK